MACAANFTALVSSLLLIAACGDKTAHGGPEPRMESSDGGPDAGMTTDEASAPGNDDRGVIRTTTSDGVTIHGQPYFGNLGADAPLVLLFHQGGSNGRAEYGDTIAPWLNEHGFRAIAWDQRSGGSHNYGGENRTVAGLADNANPGYCEAAPDLQAALDYVIDNNLADDVIAWGSSYSGALVFQLAVDNPDLVAGVIAFSPASGGPLASCRARMWVREIGVPIFVLKPASEMARESSLEQRELLTAAGAEFRVIENGVHGSSMLVDDRTGNDMSVTRAAVLAWLRQMDHSATRL